MSPRPHKHRASSFLRKRYVVALVALIIVALAGRAVYVSLTARPGAPVDYAAELVRATAQAQPAVTAENNGWPHLAAAAAAYDRVSTRLFDEFGDEPADLGQPWVNSWPADFAVSFVSGVPQIILDHNNQLEREAVAAGVIDELKLFAAAPGAYRPGFDVDPANPELAYVTLAELGPCRRIAQMLAMRMRRDALAGDMAGLIENFDQLMAAASAFTQQGTLIDHLVGYAIATLGCREVGYLIYEGLIKPDAFAELTAVLDERRLGPFPLALTGERLFFHDLVQRVYSDDGHGDGMILLTRMSDPASGMDFSVAPAHISRPPAIVNVVGLFMPGKKAVLEKADAFFDKAAAVAQTPAAERGSDVADLDAEVETLPKGYYVIKQFMPAVAKSIQQHDAAQLQIEGLRISLALEAFRADHGQYPASLDALLPDYVRHKLIDPVTGLAYGYRRLAPDEDPAGGGYVLYSFGLDGVDNGGALTPAPATEAVFSKSAGAGKDLVLNTPRPLPDAPDDADIPANTPADTPDAPADSSEEPAPGGG